MMSPYRHARNRTGCHPRRRGFSLIEVMIVLAVLGIIGALAWPTYAGYIARTRRTEGQVALIEAMQKQERYHMQHNTYVAFTAQDADGAGFTWWSGARAAASAYELDAQACPGQDIADCVVVRAHPGTARVDGRFRDPDCGMLTLDSIGRQGAAGEQAAPDGAPQRRCWP